MSDRMRPIPFSEMLRELMEEYKRTQSLAGVKTERSFRQIPLGPAAGPHTQLAGNLVAAYSAGTSWFELKTVQILEGEALGIKKPCIHAGDEVYNIEWSSELTLAESLREYIKAYLLIQVLARELSIEEAPQLHFIISVGYDLKGIQSPQVDTFIEGMKEASETEEWKEDMAYLYDHLDGFTYLTKEDLDEISSKITDTVTLSTMHGCPAEEIEKIACYLVEEKQLNTYIKMNPTLPGKKQVQEILQKTGYGDLEFDEKSFQHDITMTKAIEIIAHVSARAKAQNKIFGIKLTNTFPVKNTKGKLLGEEMYLSGAPLYGLSITTAALLAEATEGKIPISYSGGADPQNIQMLMQCGMTPVTVSSYLLKPGGYSNLTRLLRKANETYKEKEKIDVEQLKACAAQVVQEKTESRRLERVQERSKEYEAFCSACRCCETVCPNRANSRITIGERTIVLHRDRLCNECGNCSCFCIKGHDPYLEKFTVFESKEDYEDSLNEGVLVENGICICYRFAGRKENVADHQFKIEEFLVWLLSI